MVRELADVGVYSDEPGEEGRLTTTFDFADHRLPMAAFQTLHGLGAGRKLTPVWSKNSTCLNPIVVAGSTCRLGKEIQTDGNITLQGPELARNVFEKPLGAAGPSPVVSVSSSILTTRGKYSRH
jgi:hypothetical protein